MSFSATTGGGVPLADLPAVIDALVPSPPLETDEAKTLFTTAQEAAKSIVAHFDGGYPVSVSISGHACQEETDWPYDSVYISVGEVEPPPPVLADPPAAAVAVAVS